MVLVHTEIEIPASPERVREVFLDFASWPEWSHGTIKAIGSHKNGSEIAVGDSLELVLEGMTIQPVLIEKSEKVFKWRGSSLGVLVGEHAFRFEESKTSPGSTTFTHEEDFQYLFAILMMLPIGLYGKVKAGYEKFNQDLKARVEGSS